MIQMDYRLREKEILHYAALLLFDVKEVIRRIFKENLYLKRRSCVCVCVCV